jgi:type IV pilus assembly protein PilN
MIPINLLPHRAERRKRQLRQFLVMSGTVVAAATVVWILGHTFFAQRIDSQAARNKYLQDQIGLLDKQIDEIKKLKEQTQAMLERKKVVESLQSNRTEAVRLLDQLVRQLPEGLYLKSVKQTNDVINVVGYASSNARVSTLMRNFASSPWLEQPTLVEIKAVKAGNATLSEFNVNVKMTREAAEGAHTAAKPTAAAQPAKQG